MHVIYKNHRTYWSWQKTQDLLFCPSFFALRHQRLREDKGCSYRHKIKYLQTPHHLFQVQSFFYTIVNLTIPGNANYLPAQLLSCTDTAIFLASIHSFPLEFKCLNVRFFKPILFKYFQTLIQDFFFNYIFNKKIIILQYCDFYFISIFLKNLTKDFRISSIFLVCDTFPNNIDLWCSICFPSLVPIYSVI